MATSMPMGELFGVATASGANTPKQMRSAAPAAPSRRTS